MTSMTAAVFARTGVLEIQERPVPELINDDDVLLKIEATGLCGTDLHILHDPPGHPATEGSILGHEIVAHIIEAGTAVKQFKAGQRVIVDPKMYMFQYFELLIFFL